MALYQNLGTLEKLNFSPQKYVIANIFCALHLGGEEPMPL